MTKDECSCYVCVCRPMCSNKSYFVIAECPLLKPMFDKYYNKVVDGDRDVALHKDVNHMLYRCLQPAQWTVSTNGFVQHTIWWEDSKDEVL